METVKMTRMQVMEFYNTLKNDLGGRETPEHDKDGKFVGMSKKPYDFDTDALYAFPKTQRKMRAIVDDLEAAQHSITAKYKTISPDEQVRREEITKNNAEIRAFMAGEEEIEVHLIPKESIKAHTNKLDPSIYSNLMWMIKEEQEDIKKEWEARLARAVARKKAENPPADPDGTE